MRWKRLHEKTWEGFLDSAAFIMVYIPPPPKKNVLVWQVEVQTRLLVFKYIFFVHIEQPITWRWLVCRHLEEHRALFTSIDKKKNTTTNGNVGSIFFVCVQMRFMLLFSRQGKLRLQKWYTATAERDKKKMVRELMQIVLARKPKMCSFLEWKDLKIVYKR